MVVAVMVLGAVAEAIGWTLVAVRGRSVWHLMPWVLGAMGVAAAIALPPVAATRVDGDVAAIVGLGSGLVLYLGTLAFVAVAVRVPRFRSSVASIYGEAAEVSVATSVVLSLAVMVPAEELFWRGLFQAHLDATWSAAVGAVATWLAYVAVNSASRRPPIVAGAIVAGALWAALAAWSGGMLASFVSHMLWTGLMLVLPPGAGREGHRA
jgi:membrane protease YdiL (CAAX protease family)